MRVRRGTWISSLPDRFFEPSVGFNFSMQPTGCVGLWPGFSTSFELPIDTILHQLEVVFLSIPRVSIHPCAFCGLSSHPECRIRSLQSENEMLTGDINILKRGGLVFSATSRPERLTNWEWLILTKPHLVFGDRTTLLCVCACVCVCFPGNFCVLLQDLTSIS